MDEKKQYLEFLKSKNVPEDQMRDMFKNRFGGEENKSTTMQVLEGAGKALDYLGGITRTGAAGLGELVTGKDLYKEGDIGKALVGEAPTTSQILERGGAGEWGKLSDILPQIYSETGAGFTLKKGGKADPTGRGAVGFIGDVALDPLTYASLGLSSLAKGVGKAAIEQGAKKGLATRIGEAMVEGAKLGTKEKGLNLAGKVADIALNPIEKFTKGSSDKAYAKAFQDADKVSRETGKKPLSKILQENNFIGNATDAYNFVADYNQNIGKGIQNTLEEASLKGATADLENAFEGALKYTSEIRKNPHSEVKKLADKMDEITFSMMGAGKEVPVNQANAWKSQINDLVSDAAFKVQGLGTSGIEDKFNKILGSNLSESIQKGVEKTDPNLYETLKNLNTEYAATSGTVQKSLFRQSEKELRRKTPVSAVDLMMGGAGVVGHGTTGGASALGALAAKKTGQSAMSTKGRTIRGLAAKKITESGIGSSAVRQGFKNIKGN